MMLRPQDLPFFFCGLQRQQQQTDRPVILPLVYARGVNISSKLSGYMVCVMHALPIIIA